MSDLTIRWPAEYANEASREAAAEARIPISVVALPADAEALHAFGEEIFIHLGGAETGGKYMCFTDVAPPGGGPPPHYHENEDEWFFPLEGRAEFLLDGAWKEVPVHSLIFIPRGTVHTFRNCGDGPLKLLIGAAPAGLERYFERCAVEFATPGGPDMGRILEISAEHGIHFVDG